MPLFIVLNIHVSRTCHSCCECMSLSRSIARAKLRIDLWVYQRVHILCVIIYALPYYFIEFESVIHTFYVFFGCYCWLLRFNVSLLQIKSNLCIFFIVDTENQNDCIKPMNENVLSNVCVWKKRVGHTWFGIIKGVKSNYKVRFIELLNCTRAHVHFNRSVRFTFSRYGSSNIGL